MQNITKPPRGKSGYRGVVKSHSSKSFMAIIAANGAKHYLGSFKTAEEASAAYQAAKAAMHIGGPLPDLPPVQKEGGGASTGLAPATVRRWIF